MEFYHKLLMHKQKQEKLNEILASHSGKTMEEVVRDTDRDHFMSADEACAWGLIDKVLVPKA